MKRHSRFGLGALALCVGAMAPPAAEAQMSVQVRLVWEWRDGGWRPHQDRDVYRSRTPVARRPVVFAQSRQRIHIPPGHLPPPGYCRLWYPGVPPGHQPPAAPCETLLRVRGAPGAVLVRGSDSWTGRPGKGHKRGRR